MIKTNKNYKTKKVPYQSPVRGGEASNVQCFDLAKLYRAKAKFI